MNVIDLHPEELLDRAARGALSQGERVRLDAHLARCTACRAEQAMRLDFADELEGDDRPSAILGLVAGALAPLRTDAACDVTQAVREAAPSLVAERPTAVESLVEDDLDVVPRTRRRPRRTMVTLLFAAAVLAAGVAGAATATTRVWQSLAASVQEVTHAAAARPSSRVVATATAVAKAPMVLVEEPPLPILEVPRDAVPILAVASAPKPVADVRIARVVAASGTTASELFDVANASRRSGDVESALARYDLLERRFPASREAQISKATTGKLLLDHGDAVHALARFDAYLATGAMELHEETMAGRASALEKLGNGEAESQAWSTLLAAYPRTPYAAHARVRVGKLAFR